MILLVAQAILFSESVARIIHQPFTSTTNQPLMTITNKETRKAFNESQTILSNGTIDKLSGLYLCDIKYNNTEVIVDCSSRNLVFIPTLPFDATSVNLSHNQISMVFNSAAFLGLSELRELDLSDNPLQFIPNTLFTGLSNLTTLLMSNTLLYKQQETLVLDTLLAGLDKLKYFSFTFKLPDSTKLSPVPCWLYHNSQPFGKVDTLQAVETIKIDSTLIRWPSNRTVTFKTKTLYLINGITCFYAELNSPQFEYMPFLEILHIENPFLTAAVSGDFVSSNRNIKRLIIHGPNAPYSYAGNFIYNVTEAISTLVNITTLSLEGISDNIRMKFHCSGVGIYPLTELRSFTNLSLADNSLTLNYPEECDQFPASLKNIDLMRNCISHQEINFNILFFNKQVESIDAKDQSNCAFMEQSSKQNFKKGMKATLIITTNGY